MTLRKLLLTIATWLLATPALAQTMITTSLTNDMASPAAYAIEAFTVTDGTGFGVGSLLLIDREALIVTVVQGNTITAQRAYGGLPSAHAVGATVYAGVRSLFDDTDPPSPNCTPGSSQNPWINWRLGRVFVCANPGGTWQSLNDVGAAGAAGTILYSAGAGNAIWSLNPTLLSPNKLAIGSGTIGAPSLYFSASGSAVGWYRPNGSAKWAFTNGTTEELRIETATHLTTVQNFALSANATTADVRLTRNSAGQLKLANTGSTFFANFNVAGAPVASACGDGALQTGSSNTSGRVVGTTQVGCTLTFSVAFPDNSADCFIENLTANRGNVTAASTSAFTVSNLTAGDDFMYVCVGR